MPDRAYRPRVLWVTEEPPDHAGGGGSIRQAYLLDALATGFSVDLLVAGEVRDERVFSAVASVTEVATGERLWSEHPIGRQAIGLGTTLASRYPLLAYLSAPRRQALARAIGQSHDRYSVVCIEHEALVPLLRKRSAESWIITVHALYSEIIRRELELAKACASAVVLAPGAAQGPQTRAPCARLRPVRGVLRRRRRGAVEDRGRRERLDHGDTEWRGPGPTASRSDPYRAARAVSRDALLPAQRRGCGVVLYRDLAADLLRVPGATLVLAGRDPGSAVRELERLAGVSVHADVPSMAPYFEAARVVIVPVRSGLVHG